MKLTSLLQILVNIKKKNEQLLRGISSQNHDPGQSSKEHNTDLSVILPSLSKHAVTWEGKLNDLNWKKVKS